MHHFPAKTDPKYRLWVQFVKKKRGDFSGKDTTHAVICVAHFLKSDYNTQDIMMAEMGFKSKSKIRLNDNAVPSVYPEFLEKCQPTPAKIKRKMRAKKRDTARVRDAALYNISKVVLRMFYSYCLKHFVMQAENVISGL